MNSFRNRGRMSFLWSLLILAAYVIKSCRSLPSAKYSAIKTALSSDDSSDI